VGCLTFLRVICAQRYEEVGSVICAQHYEEVSCGLFGIHACNLCAAL